MGFGTWIRDLATNLTPQPVDSESVLEEIQSIEGQPDQYLWNGYLIGLGIPGSTTSNGFGLCLYDIYEYSELEGRGKQLALSAIKGNRQDALRAACYHVDLLILKQSGIAVR